MTLLFCSYGSYMTVAKAVYVLVIHALARAHKS